MKSSSNTKYLQSTLPQVLESWKEYTKNYFSQHIQELNNSLIELVNSLEEKIAKLPAEENERFSSLSAHKNQVLNLILNRHKEPQNEQFKSIFSTWVEQMESISEQLPATLKKSQAADRFISNPNDPVLIRWIKPLKSFFFKISRIHLFVYNVFAKKKKIINFWSHRVRLEGLFQYHFVYQFMSEWKQLDEQIMQAHCAALIQLRQYEEDTSLGMINEPPDIKKILSQLKREIKKKIDDWYVSKEEMLFTDIELSGTIEYRDAKLSAKSLIKKITRVRELWNANHNNWNNTLFALFEDWRSDIELDSIQFFVRKSKIALDTFHKDFKKESVEDFIHPITDFLRKTHKTFDFKTNEGFNKSLIQGQYQIKKQLDRGMIVPLQEKFAKNPLLNQLDRIQHQIENRVELLENQHAITKYGKYDRGIQSKELQNISNYELLSFEVLPWLNDQLEGIKNLLFQSTDELISFIGDLDEVINYTLDTAKDYLNQPDSQLKECENIVTAGFERADQKVHDIEQKIDALIRKSALDLNELLNQLEKKIHELTENENASGVRLRINKAKAIQQSEAYKQRIRNLINKFYRSIKSFFGRQVDRVVQGFNRIKAFVQPTDAGANPTKEVSNFLSESTKALNNLPIIYQRLYTIEPLTDTFLFEGREQEVSLIANVHEHWCNGKIGSVLLLGEKWSGLTTLINYFLKDQKFIHPILRHGLKHNLVHPSDTLELFKELLGKDDLATSDDVIEFLNSSKKRIIILEDLQNIYQRKIDGTKALSELVEIITSTHRNVFWITSITTYAGQYLEKSMQLFTFFSDVIRLSDLTSEQISNLIIKRNRISGFKIQFDAEDQTLRDKKYLRMSPDEKQDYLKERFFRELNDFARSNISMALIYWLLSTTKVEGNVIHISSFKNLNLTFLALLSMEKIFILHCLIIHDGLKVKDLASILSFSLQKTKMLVLTMEDDGILMKKEDEYLVNLLVYRNVIQLLKSKNLIY